jgi:hypothetical protein
MDGWSLPWDGGCRCGQARLRIVRPPLLTGICHCSGCQKMSASAFSTTITLPGDGLEVLAGELVRGGLQQGPAHHHFCAWCKSWLFTRVEGMDWFVNVRATMLNDHGWFVPFVQLWTSEKLPWAESPATHSFATSPELAEWEGLMKDYAARGVRPARTS